VTDVLYSKMAIPEACHLGKRVFKKLFAENASLTAADKRAFSEDIDTVTWQYTLKPSTIPISAYEDEEREYHEVAILQVNLKTRKRTRRIAEVIHRSIPYPVFLVLNHSPAFAVSVAHKRFSKAEKDAIVAEDIQLTDWIDSATPSESQVAFLESLALSGLPHTHFLDLYSAFVHRLSALDAARLSGRFSLYDSVEQQELRQRRLDSCRAIEQQIAELRSILKKETQFNNQVDLNTKIKRLEHQLHSESTLL